MSYSSGTVAALHDRYDVVVEVRVTIPLASPSSLGQGKIYEAWTVNP